MEISFGRVQRSKGGNIMQALKVMLVLTVGAWLLYQIKHSTNDAENYSDQIKHDGGHGAILLGRKGTPSQLDEMDFPDSGNVDSAGEAKESDGTKEDKAEEEFRHINEIFSTGKEVELEPESQLEVSSKNPHKDFSKTKSGKVGLELRTESVHKEHGNENYSKRTIINDSKSNDKEEEVQLKEQLNDDVQFRRNETNAEVTEEIDEVRSFHDENGVPPDVNETEIVFGQAHIVHEENISNVSKGSWLRKHIYEVTYVEDNTVEVK